MDDTEETNHRDRVLAFHRSLDLQPPPWAPDYLVEWLAGSLETQRDSMAAIMERAVTAVDDRTGRSSAARILAACDAWGVLTEGLIARLRADPGSLARRGVMCALRDYCRTGLPAGEAPLEGNYRLQLFLAAGLACHRALVAAGWQPEDPADGD